MPKILDQVVWEGRQYLSRSQDDKVLVDEGRLILLLNQNDATLIHHFEESPGVFRADVRFRDIRFMSHKTAPFRFIPLKDPRRPLQS